MNRNVKENGNGRENGQIKGLEGGGLNSQWARVRKSDCESFWT